MTENRMLIVDADLLRKIDDNRGDMSRSDFINFLISSSMKDEIKPSTAEYVSRDEFEQFARGIKDLLRHFLDFFISYGLELGEEPKDQSFEELTKKLQSLASSQKAPPAK